MGGMTNVTVLGAGAWGTGFGRVVADAGNDVTMWAIEPEIVTDIRENHQPYFPHFLYY